MSAPYLTSPIAALRWLFLLILICVGSLSPRPAKADALSLVLQLADVGVGQYIQPVKLEWIPAIASALSSPACANLNSDVGVAKCADGLLSTDAGGSLGNDPQALKGALEIYLDLRAGDWVDLFDDMFRLATGGSPLDVACLAISVVASGLPVCDLLKLLFAGLEAIGDGAKVVAGALNNWGETFLQAEHVPWQDYFNAHWLPRVEEVAKGSGTGSDPNAWTNVLGGKNGVYNQCFEYFDGHRVDNNHSLIVCDAMRDGTDGSAGHEGGGIGEFVGKGFLQLVYWRLQEFFLLTAGNKALAAAITKYDTPANRKYPAPPPELAPFWPDEAKVGTSISSTLRDIYGVNSDNPKAWPPKTNWPAKTVMALAGPIARGRAPDTKDARLGAEKAISDAEALVGFQERIDLAKARNWDAFIAYAKSGAEFNKQKFSERDALSPLCDKKPNPVACKAELDAGDLACKALTSLAGINPLDRASVGATVSANQAKIKECYEQLALKLSASVAVQFNPVGARGELGIGTSSKPAGTAAGLAGTPGTGGGVAVLAPPDTTRRVGMPGLPTMGVIRPTLAPGAQGANVPPPGATAPTSPNLPVSAVPVPGATASAPQMGARLPAESMVRGSIGAVTAVPAVPEGLSGQLPQILGAQNPVTTGAASPAVLAAAAPLRIPGAVAVPSAVVPPQAPAFDRDGYVRGRLAALQSGWAARCQSQPNCLQLIARQASLRAEEEASALAGNPATAANAVNVARIQAALDAKYEAIVGAAWAQAAKPPAAVTIQPPPAPSASIKVPSQLPPLIVVEPPSPQTVVRPPPIRIQGVRP